MSRLLFQLRGYEIPAIRRADNPFPLSRTSDAVWGEIFSGEGQVLSASLVRRPSANVARGSPKPAGNTAAGHAPRSVPSLHGRQMSLLDRVRACGRGPGAILIPDGEPDLTIGFDQRPAVFGTNTLVPLCHIRNSLVFAF
jgi:hypothetical protein